MQPIDPEIVRVDRFAEKSSRLIKRDSSRLVDRVEMIERQIESVDRMLPLNIFSRTAHHYTNIHAVRNIQAGSVL